MPNWASLRPPLRWEASIEDSFYPDADAKLQEAFEYSVIGHLFLSPDIIFIIDPKYIKNIYLQRSYGFSIFICL